VRLASPVWDDPAVIDPAPLTGVRLVCVAINLPGPAAAARLAELGASVTKVEPPSGDPLQAVSPELYGRLTDGQTALRLDLKDAAGRARLHELLADADVLLTSSRPSALARMGLARDEIEARHPQLVHVAIVGHPAPDQERPGHDLTYVAAHGLVSPPQLPQALVADLGGAERAATAAVALLHARERGAEGRYAEIALADSAAFFALPWEHGLTIPNGPLGGGSPFYGLYEAGGGWVGVAALEPHFRERLATELGGEPTEETFRSRTPGEWEQWAEEHDLPIAAVAGCR
jgi:crotonobetainyl-CoA:carnitine CoA-transferase CaiB-like acyl-CoA transferase